MSFSAAALDDLKGRVLCHEIAGKWVKLRKSGSAWVGPCPLCSRDPNKKTSTKFKATDQRWMCAACMDGGDVIELVRKVEGKDFAGAVEWLGGVQEIDQAEADRRKAERDAKAAAAEKSSEEYREKERGTAYEIWKRGLKKDQLAGSSLERYFELRGLSGAPRQALRCIEAMPYYDSGKKDAVVVHRGPAMLAAFLRPRPAPEPRLAFSAVHITWLDLNQPKGKLKLTDGDGEEMIAKKMRGSKSAGVIVLVEPADGVAIERIFIGEGIETVLSAWCALAVLGLLRPGDAFYCAGDLGNMAGKSAESVSHPTLKDAGGRTKRVPGPWADMDSPSIALPESAREIVILGDGDSDPFNTRCSLARASTRFAAPGREVRVAMAPDGSDFNDIWRAERDAGAVCALIDAAAPLTPDDVMAASLPGGALATAPTRASAANGAAPERADNVGGRISSPAHETFPAETDPPAEGDTFFSPSAAAAPPPAGEERSERPSRVGGSARPGTRSANRARWGGPPRKFGEGKQALDCWLAFFPMTELGLIERYVQRNKHRLKYCEALGWLLWNGRCWTRTGAEGAAVAAGHEVVRAVQDEAEAIVEADLDEIVGIKPGKKKDDEPTEILLSDLLMQFGRASETKARMTLHEHSEPYLSVEIDELDADPFAINIQNGTLLVRREWDNPLPAGWRHINANIRLKPHDQTDLMTKIMPVTFDADAESPRYDTFMSQVQPSEAMRDFLDDWNGYSLTGDASEQKLVFHHGKGKNGKSTELAVRLALVGDYGKSIPIETFVSEGRARSAGQATPDLAMLRRVRTLVTSEPEKGWKLNEALIKVLTGGDEVPVRELHRSYFMLKPEFKLSIGGNFKPNISGGEAESGIWRRVALVPWAVTISKAQRDPHLVDKLKREGSGILNRWLAGLARWMQRGLVLPDEVAKATENFRIASDPLGRFLDECTKADEHGSIQSTALHQLFCAWCKVAGEKEWTPTGFGKAMDERGFIKVKRSNHYWDGLVAIKTVNEFIDHEGRPLVRAAPAEGGSTPAPDIPERAQAWADDDDVPM